MAHRHLQAAAFRTRILRSVDFGEALEERTSRDISSVGHEYTPELFVYLNSFTTKVLTNVMCAPVLCCVVLCCGALRI